MQKIYSLLFIIFTISLSCSAQTTFQPLREGGWVGGLAGMLGWENFDTEVSGGGQTNVSGNDGFNFTLSSRNGRFFQDNFTVGFDFQWDEKTRTTEPKINPTGKTEETKNRLGFLGLWLRYYFPIPNSRWAFFPEGSIGYAMFKLNNEDKDNNAVHSKVEGNANGLGYNIGAGVAHFVNSNVSFELTVRYQGGNLKGDVTDTNGSSNDLTVALKNIDVLVGLQVYIQ